VFSHFDPSILPAHDRPHNTSQPGPTASDPKYAMDPFEFLSWCPTGVQRVIAAGASNFIGFVDEKTVLKFPLVCSNEKNSFSHGFEHRQSLRDAAVKGLEIENLILQHLGQHPRIVGLLGIHEDGLLLENMANGSVDNYLRNNSTRTPSSQRLQWACQAADGLAYVHSKGVLHCDISVGNFLLNSDLELKMCDFQGRLLNHDESIILNGGAAESTMSSMPRPVANLCDQKTDMFALGTAIYVMMSDQLPFPDLDPAEDEEEIQKRFREFTFPPLETVLTGSVVRKCWMGGYATASEIAKDLRCMVDYNLE
jgi:serine/threonine protein kinase